MDELAPGMSAAPNVRLERPLGQGGMGSVWVAEHLTLKTHVAVKFMLPEFARIPELAARFSREAAAAAQLKSPHVVQVFDHGTTEKGTPFIVMELLEGEDLGARLDREGTLSLAETSHIVTQVARALTRAHARGIVHRDIKPDNVFLIDEGGEPFVKVLDFGVAKLREEGELGVTATGSMIGTPAYMSHEQMTNAKAVGPASDVYALAVLTYRAVTGLLPFDGATLAALAIAVDKGRFVRPSALVPALPKAFDAWCEQGLARDPELRFASVRELAERLAELAKLAPDARATVARGKAPAATSAKAAVTELPPTAPAPRAEARAATARAEPARAEPARPEPARAEAPRLDKPPPAATVPVARAAAPEPTRAAPALSAEARPVEATPAATPAPAPLEKLRYESFRPPTQNAYATRVARRREAAPAESRTVPLVLALVLGGFAVGAGVLVVRRVVSAAQPSAEPSVAAGGAEPTAVPVDSATEADAAPSASASASIRRPPPKRLPPRPSATSTGSAAGTSSAPPPATTSPPPSP